MGKFGINKSFCTANGLNGGESAEKFKLGFNNFANPCRLFTETLLPIESTMIGQRRKMNYERNHLPLPFQYQRKVWNLSGIYLNSNKQNVFILKEVTCQTQNFKFLMSNFPWQVMIAQNLPEFQLPIVQHFSCNLEAISNHNFLFFLPYFRPDPKLDALLYWVARNTSTFASCFDLRLPLRKA